jgi:hypothetical protein
MSLNVNEMTFRRFILVILFLLGLVSCHLTFRPPDRPDGADIMRDLGKVRKSVFRT